MANTTKICALTFDDGPDNILTTIVLEKLKKYNVPATFFMIGILVNDSTSATVKQVISQGCEIGNYSWDHPYMTNLTEAETQCITQSTRHLFQVFEQTIGFRQ